MGNWGSIFLGLWGLVRLRIISSSYEEPKGIPSLIPISHWLGLVLLCLRSDQVPPDQREPSVREAVRCRSLRISATAAGEHSGGPHVWGVASVPALSPATLPPAKAGEISAPASPSHDLRRSNHILISAMWAWFIIDETFPTEVDVQFYTSPKSSNLLCDGFLGGHIYSFLVLITLYVITRLITYFW